MSLNCEIAKIYLFYSDFQDRSAALNEIASAPCRYKPNNPSDKVHESSLTIEKCTANDTVRKFPNLSDTALIPMRIFHLLLI